MIDDLFQTKNIQPMLIADNASPFSDPDFIYEIKWDGERCVAYLDPQEGTELRNKRNIRMLPKFPELECLHMFAKSKCVLDGELMTLVDGKPKFGTVQRRSLISNRLKIDLESKKHPATFVAFDCLYYGDKDLTFSPLQERKDYLKKAIQESDRLAISRSYDSSQALALFQLMQQQQLEGIVAKRKDSLYIQGTRTKNWLKIKNLMDDDFVVCGYIHKKNNMSSLVLGQYRDGELIYQGHVTLGVGGKPFAVIKNHPLVEMPAVEAPSGHGNENAVWIEPTLVCTVKFMHRTENGDMRQPVFKGLRPDKLPEECKTER